MSHKNMGHKHFDLLNPMDITKTCIIEMIEIH